MERRPQGGEWQEVVGRRSNRRVTSEEWEGREKIQITKFFVSNLPEDCSRKEIAGLFGEYGEVTNVYIARKRNVSGQIFGFISFANVYDGLDLQRKLGRISVGGNKIRVNIAKYAVENFDQRFANPKGASKEGSKQARVAAEKSYVRTEPFVHGGSSYLEKLLNVKGQGKGGEKKNNAKVVSINDDFAAFHEYHGKAVVGKVMDFDTLRNVKSLLQKDKWDGFEVAYIGGLFVLVVFEEEGQASLFFKSEGWRSWFSEADIWKGQTFPFEKLVWLNVVGVPLHLAGTKVFDLIGGKFGKVVHHGDPQVEDGDISAGCVGILRDNGVEISEEVKLQWKEMSFSVWVREVGGSWIPEGVGKVDRRSRDDDDLSVDSSDQVGERSQSSSVSIQSESEGVSLEEEPAFGHGESEGRGESNKSFNEGGEFTFNGVNYGRVFPSKTKNKRKVKVNRKIGTGKNFKSLKMQGARLRLGPKKGPGMKTPLG